MKKGVVIGVLFFLFCLLLPLKMLYAETYSAEGNGKTAQEAKREALSDLCMQICVQVQSEFEKWVKGRIGAGKLVREIKKHVRTSSNLPILKAEITVQEFQKEYKAFVVLSSDKALPAYKARLSALEKEINSLWLKVQRTKKQKVRYEALLELLSLIDAYEKHYVVATALGYKEPLKLPVSRSEVKVMLAEMRGGVKSIELAGRLLGEELKKGVGKAVVYVYPAVMEGSSLPTEFGEAVRQALKPYFTTVEEPSRAEYLLRGSYTLGKGEMLLVYEAIEPATGVVKKSACVRLLPEAYRGYRVKSEAQTYDDLLRKGLIVSSRLRVELVTNKGKRELVFHEGESVKLLLKANTPCYFYIVGHTMRKDGRKFSYLVELGDYSRDGKRAFVGYISPEEVKKWVELGEFKVTRPLGTEMLQVFASNKDLINSLPKCRWKENGLCVLGEDISRNIVGTRALVKKHRKKQETAEAVLSFVTMPKNPR